MAQASSPVMVPASVSLAGRFGNRDAGSRDGLPHYYRVLTADQHAGLDGGIAGHKAPHRALDDFNLVHVRFAAEAPSARRARPE